MNGKIQIIAPILTEENEYKEVATALGIPSEEKRQTDLQYFTALFVSSGGNLNHAYFLPSELFKAAHTIDKKAVDMEHLDREVVGHIYDKAFITQEENSVVKPKTALKDPEVDKLKVHALIAGIIYSQRFPEVAQEVKMGKWKVSMECYFDSFDIKVGEVIIPRPEAESLGYAEYIGKPVKVNFKGKEINNEMVYRVLRGILFTGCGLVMYPANPPSVILEYAEIKKRAEETNAIIELENVESYMKAKQEEESLSVESLKKEEKSAVIDWKCNICGGVVSAEQPPAECPKCGADISEFRSMEDEKDNPTSFKSGQGKDKDKGTDYNVDNVVSPDDPSADPGVCVNFKRHVWDKVGEGGKPVHDAKLVHENWCSRYDQGCTVPSAYADNPGCLRFKYKELVIKEANKLISKREKAEFIKELIKEINDMVREYEDNIGIEKAAKWTRKFINDLPNGAFAVVEPAYTSGKTDNKNARHLPHHTCSGGTTNKCLDMSHLRNALARANQVKPVTDSISTDKLRSKAANHLEKHRGALKTNK